MTLQAALGQGRSSLGPSAGWWGRKGLGFFPCSKGDWAGRGCVGTGSAEYLSVRCEGADRKPHFPHCPPRPQSLIETPRGLTRVTQGGGTAAGKFLPPGELGGSVEKVTFLWEGDLYLFFLFLFLEERRGTHGLAHTPGGEAGPGAGAAPGLALERVGADGSGSQSSRRSCGTPGTSGPGQARGPPGGRKEHPASPPLGACGCPPPASGALPH